MTVNRVCGSGAQAIVTTAQQIATGDVDCAFAGGFENMDLAPHLLGAARWAGMFGLAPVPSIQTAMARAGWRLGEVERLEINEAFAAVALAIMQKLDLPEAVVNVEGGAIAHGHPIGATGAILAARLLHSMRRDGLRRGVVALCIGGGMGIALTLEAA